MTNAFIELLEDLQDILTTCPDVHWRSRVERAVDRAGGIRTYYDVEEAAEARGRADCEAEIVAMCRTRAPAPGYVTPAVAAAVNEVVAGCVERGEYRPKGGG